jgi:four helix bundle protein
MILREKEIAYGNALLDKSFNFSIRIIKFYKFEVDKKIIPLPILNQILRSGTSIGANISEAQSAFTRKDFINKLGISLKESKETEYWLRIMNGADILPLKEFESLKSDCEELLKLLTSIIKSSKSKTQ